MEFVDLKPRLSEPEVIRILSLSMFQPVNPDSLARVLERIGSYDERRLWGMTDGERIIGVIHYYIADSSVYIANISVDEPFRLQGVGSAMVFAVRNKYNIPVCLETDDDAIGFYKKLGFTAEPFEKFGVRRWKCILEPAGDGVNT